MTALTRVATLPRPPQPDADLLTPKRRKGAPDWEAIERDYRTNLLTFVQMTEKHGPSRQSILNKAARDGWTRDLSVAIKRRTARKLIERMSKDDRPVSLQSVTDDISHVEAIANVTVEVILRHRSGIKDLQEIANGQLIELRATTVGHEAIQRVLHLAAEGGVIDSDTLKNAVADVQALCRLPSRMGGLSTLTGIYERLQNLERQAFGIKGDENPEDEEDDVKGLLVGFVEAPFREVD